MPKRVNHEERRARIAHGVIAVMAQHGIAAVSLRSVARAGKVSMGQVQHYFATKSELVRHACQLFVNQATQQYAATRDSAPAERLERLLMMGIPATPDQRIGTAVWHEFISAAANDNQLADLIAGAWRARRRHLMDLIDELGDESSSTAVLADLLAATADGLASRAVVGDVEYDEARTVMAVQLSVLGLAPQPAAIVRSGQAQVIRGRDPLRTQEISETPVLPRV